LERVLPDAEARATVSAAMIRYFDGAATPMKNFSATAPNKEELNLLPLARSSFSWRLFWGEQPPLTPVGCGGRSLFDQEV